MHLLAALDSGFLPPDVIDCGGSHQNRHLRSRKGRVRTYDMGGKDSTLDVAKAIAD